METRQFTTAMYGLGKIGPVGLSAVGPAASAALVSALDAKAAAVSSTSTSSSSSSDKSAAAAAAAAAASASATATKAGKKHRPSGKPASPDLDTVGVSNTLWAFGKLKVALVSPSSKKLHPLCKKAAELLPEMNAQDCANTAYGLAHAVGEHERAGPLYGALHSALTKKVGSFKPQELCCVLSALAVLASSSSSSAAASSSASGSGSGSGSAGGLEDLVSAGAPALFHPGLPGTLKALFSTVRRTSNSLMARDVSQIIHSTGKLWAAYSFSSSSTSSDGEPHPVLRECADPALLSVLYSRISANVGRFNSQDVANTLVGLAALCIDKTAAAAPGGGGGGNASSPAAAAGAAAAAAAGVQVSLFPKEACSVSAVLKSLPLWMQETDGPNVSSSSSSAPSSSLSAV
jgi:hypothetical protein